MPFNRLSMMQYGGIPSALFKSMLDLLPPDTTFVGCGFDGMQNSDYLFFTSDQFVDTPQAMTIPDIYCNFRTYTNGSVKTTVAESIDFGKAMPSPTPPTGTYNITLPNAHTSCYHNWIKYNGLGDSYNFCVLCGVRQ